MKKLGGRSMSLFYGAKDLYIQAGRLGDSSTVEDVAKLRLQVQWYQKDLTKAIEAMKRK